MKTKRINVFQQHQEWLRWHTANADGIEYDGRSGQPKKAVYLSPLEKWRGLMDDQGFVNVPDMDYYNNLLDTTEMTEVLDELKG